jgi:hypothetical protein
VLLDMVSNDSQSLADKIHKEGGSSGSSLIDAPSNSRNIKDF